MILEGADSDGDGMPDTYEKINFGNATNAVATDDPDMDTFNNLAEFIAATDPGNSASVFRVEGIAADPSVSFLTASGRVYLVEGNADPVNGAWITVESDIAGDGDVLSVSDTNEAPARSYRVDVRLAP